MFSIDDFRWWWWNLLGYLPFSCIFCIFSVLFEEFKQKREEFYLFIFEKKPNCVKKYGRKKKRKIHWEILKRMKEKKTLENCRRERKEHFEFGTELRANQKKMVFNRKFKSHTLWFAMFSFLFFFSCWNCFFFISCTRTGWRL